MSANSKGLSQRVGQLESSAVAEMLELGRKLAAQGREIIPLVQGEPDFDTPPHIREAAYRALVEGHTHYIPAQGLLALRQAVAGKLKRENGIEADPGTEILITSGATMGLHLVMLAILETGDEVLLPDPTYGPFQSIVALSGGICRFIPTIEKSGHFRLTVEAVEEVVTPRTKAIIVCTPNNPTGDVLRTEELKAVAQVAARHGLFVVADEVYEKLVYDGLEHRSILALVPEISDQIILVNAFSKTYAMTGWRLGYNVANSALTRAMTKINQFSGRMPASFVQYAGIAALEGPQDAIVYMLEAYRRRRDMILEGLDGVPGLICPRPEGTFYVFVDARATGFDSWKLAQHVLEVGGVITTPGAHYGPKGEGHLRLSYAYDTPQLAKGIAGLRYAFERLG
ncbi:MAG: pyridoxal phosphate-dependent aminotransferase [Deltaproteobacteria bacterium]|nr:pyridoxal phosphate-dependent aminotransferase [Deltaproteobacteria bacterium]